MHCIPRSCGRQPSPTPPPTGRLGFTIIELLVAMAIIGVLVSLVLVSFKGVRASASRAESLNALRNIARGYASYHTDYRGFLLPGYADVDALNELDLEAELENGTQLTACAGERCDASAYVWRLAPYLDDAWATLYVDYRSEPLIAKLDERFRNGVYGPGSGMAGDLLIATLPSFGLNSIFLGGDAIHGDAATVMRNPFDPADPDDVIAATRLSQVRNPPRITVFASTMQATSSPYQPNDELQQDIVFGYPELRPPFTEIDPDGQGDNPQWEINADGVIVSTNGSYSTGGGWPIGRWGENSVPVAHLDGSVESVDRYELGDRGSMSRWSPFATGIR